MNSDKAINNLQTRISGLAAEKLGRSLTAKETAFITSRRGFLALEAIHDSVSSFSSSEVERYLNSK